MSQEQVKRVRKRVVVFFCILSLCMIWPVYPLFSRIHPMFLGIPFSLFYLIVLLFLSFSTLLWLYLYEERQGDTD